MSYRPNLDHRLLSERGFFQLDQEMAETLLRVLSDLPDPEDLADPETGESKPLLN